VRQRGNGAFTTNGFTADRWQRASLHSTGSFSDSAVAISDADRGVLGDEAAAFQYQSVVTGGSGSTDFDILLQNIEGVRRLAGKTVTLSFSAHAASGTPKIGIEAQQIFGTGGSPSATVTGINSTAVTLGTGYARYAVTFAMPSISGKTLGTNNDDYSQISLWLSGGSSYAARSGGVGVQSGTFSIWGVELTISRAPFGSVERRQPQVELALCQRFYQTGAVQWYTYGAAGQLLALNVPLLLTMRAAPTVTPSWVLATNVTGNTLGAISGSTLQLAASVTALGVANLQVNYTATADI
jgi:hypothetical protein